MADNAQQLTALPCFYLNNQGNNLLKLHQDVREWGEVCCARRNLALKRLPFLLMPSSAQRAVGLKWELFLVAPEKESQTWKQQALLLTLCGRPLGWPRVGGFLPIPVKF